MTAVDKDDVFLKDLQECLDLADQLKEVDTDDNRQFVSEQLQELHKFLQKKTEEFEEPIARHYRREQKEIEQLQERIKRATESKGDEKDIQYADLDEIWYDLKEDYWEAAYHAYLAQTEDSVEVILNNLITILRTTYGHCKILQKEKQNEIMFQMFLPGEDSGNKELKLPKHVDKEIQQISKSCQKRAAPFCLASVQEVIGEEVEADKRIAKLLKKKELPLLRALRNYLVKCVEFCWFAAFEEPELFIVTQPKKECGHLADKFPDLTKTMHKNRSDAAVVAWPALVQGDQVRSDWKLYATNQARPEPDLKRHPNNDYRAVRFEDERGREIVVVPDLIEDSQDNGASDNKEESESNDTKEQERTSDANEDETIAQPKPPSKGPSKYTSADEISKKMPKTMDF